MKLEMIGPRNIYYLIPGRFLGKEYNLCFVRTLVSGSLQNSDCGIKWKIYIIMQGISKKSVNKLGLSWAKLSTRLAS